MENRIVQLSEYEYNRLQEKAELNDTKIRNLAEKYYQERGVFRIDVRVGLQDKYNSDTVYYTHVFSCENGLYKNDEFRPIITEKGRRKIERILSLVMKPLRIILVMQLNSKIAMPKHWRISRSQDGLRTQ